MAASSGKSSSYAPHRMVTTVRTFGTQSDESIHAASDASKARNPLRIVGMMMRTSTTKRVNAVADRIARQRQRRNQAHQHREQWQYNHDRRLSHEGSKFGLVCVCVFGLTLSTPHFLAEHLSSVRGPDKITGVVYLATPNLNWVRKEISYTASHCGDLQNEQIRVARISTLSCLECSRFMPYTSTFVTCPDLTLEMVSNLGPVRFGGLITSVKSYNDSLVVLSLGLP